MAEGKALAAYCKYCGAKLGNRDIYCPKCSNQVRTRKSDAKKSKIKKGIVPALIGFMSGVVVTLAIVFIVYSISSGNSDPARSSGVTTESTEPSTSEAATETTAAPSDELASSGALGDFEVQINDFTLGRDYQDSPAVLVSYTFTNNSDEATSATASLVSRAYQNGVELDSALITGNESYNSQDSLKDVQPGASIDLQTAFVLSSETAPVEFEMTEAFSFSDSKLGKTFAISDGGITELSVAPSGSSIESIGDYSVSVVSHEIVEDYEGKKAVLIELGFTNNSNDATNFLTALSCSAFQDGIELELAFVTGEDAGNGSTMRNIKPGAGTAVTIEYLLDSDTSPVEIEIEEPFSFSDEKIKTEIDITD